MHLVRADVIEESAREAAVVPRTVAPQRLDVAVSSGPPPEARAQASLTPPGRADAPPRKSLSPSFSDRRSWIWRPIEDPADLTLRTEHALIRGRIEDFHRGRTEAASRVTGAADWSRSGPRGQRWGLSPGRLHVGSATVPTCLGGGVDPADCGFGMLPNRRVEYSTGLRTFTEIRRQAHRVDVEDAWTERAEAIRSRRDSERRDTTAVVRR